jgi:hypothetical protein
MSNKYCTINEGAGGLNKRFKALEMRPEVRPTKTIETTVGGGYDVSHGGVYESYRLTLRVPWHSADANYGTYKDLLQIARRNNPNGTPGTKFTFIDHYGNTHTNAMFGPDSLSPEPLTMMIDTNGNESSYIIQVTILLAPGDTVVPAT